MIDHIGLTQRVGYGDGGIPRLDGVGGLGLGREDRRESVARKCQHEGGAIKLFFTSLIIAAEIGR